MAKKQGKKKKDKVIEPQYYVSATNMRTYNYKVYHMPVYEKILFFLLAFAVGAGIGYLFYGGIGKDAYGQPTKITYCLNVIIPGIIGISNWRSCFLISENEAEMKILKVLQRCLKSATEKVET